VLSRAEGVDLLLHGVPHRVNDAPHQFDHGVFAGMITKLCLERSAMSDTQVRESAESVLQSVRSPLTLV